jgi:hypothetical protein
MNERILVGSRTVNELRARFVGKYIVAERELSYDEYVKMAGPVGWRTSWHPGFALGAAGLIIDFVVQNGVIVARDDEGWEWRIWPLTTIKVID